MSTMYSQSPAESSAATADAMRTVTLYLLAETFDLRPEEIMWCGWRFDGIHTELSSHTPHTLLLAARQEILTDAIGGLLDRRLTTTRGAGQTQFNGEVAHASLDEWTETIAAPILLSYTLPVISETRVRAEIRTILAELGIGNPTNPRASTFLPSSLRSRIAAPTKNLSTI
jgi:hypothetical protein